MALFCQDHLALKSRPGLVTGLCQGAYGKGAWGSLLDPGEVPNVFGPNILMTKQ